MHLSLHASRRRQHRGIPIDVLKILQDFGSETHSAEAVTCVLDQQAIILASEDDRHLRARLEKYKGCYAVVGDDDRVVTVARRLRRFRKGGARRAFRKHASR